MATLELMGFRMRPPGHPTRAEALDNFCYRPTSSMGIERARWKSKETNAVTVCPAGAGVCRLRSEQLITCLYARFDTSGLSRRRYSPPGRTGTDEKPKFSSFFNCQFREG